MQRSIALTFAFVVSSFTAESALACRYSPSYSAEQIGQLAREAPLVMLASKISEQSNTSGRFKVYQWLKGRGQEEIEIGQLGAGTDCRSAGFSTRSIMFITLTSEGAYALYEKQTYSGVHVASSELITAVQNALAK